MIVAPAALHRNTAEAIAGGMHAKLPFMPRGMAVESPNHPMAQTYQIESPNEEENKLDFDDPFFDNDNIDLLNTDIDID